MKPIIKKTANSDIPRSIVAIIAGIVFLVVPGYVSDLLWVISAVLFIAVGIYDFVRFIANIVIDKSRVNSTRLILLRAVLLIVFGVVLLRYHKLFVSVTTVLFGLIFVFEGVVSFFKVFDKKTMKKPLKWFSLIAAVVSFGLGILIIIEPFEGVNTIIRLIGATLIISAVERGLSYVKPE